MNQEFSEKFRKFLIFTNNADPKAGHLPIFTLADEKKGFFTNLIEKN